MIKLLATAALGVTLMVSTAQAHTSKQPYYYGQAGALASDDKVLAQQAVIGMVSATKAWMSWCSLDKFTAAQERAISKEAMSFIIKASLVKTSHKIRHRSINSGINWKMNKLLPNNKCN